MVVAFPLGSNYEWSVTSDHSYAPRGLSDSVHEELAILAVAADAKLMQLEKKLGHKVVLAVSVGKNNMHVRVYDYRLHNRHGGVMSRVYQDPATYLEFRDGKLVVVVGELRDNIRSHPVLFGAVRSFSPMQKLQIDNYQVQLTGQSIVQLGKPVASSPLETFEEVFEKEPPTLEPVLEETT